MRDPRLLVVALSVVPLLAGCSDPSGGAPTTAPGERMATVRTLRLEPEAVVDRVRLPADIEPDRRAVLAAEVSGVVEAVEVEEGDRVARGQVLLQIDRRSQEQRVREAEAVHRLRVTELERAERLFERQSITKAQLLDAVTQSDVAEAELAGARLELDKSTVKAPWAGVVARRAVERGDYVGPGMPVVELVAVDRLDVTAPVAAGDVPYVAVGAPVTVRVDALADAAFEATIVRLAAELDPSSRTLQVEAELDNAGGELKPGMPAHLEIVRRRWDAALLVPASALVELGEERAVYVVEDGLARRRLVTPGPVIGDRVLLEEGVAAGEEVVVEGQRQISDGQPVDVVGEGA